MVIKRHGNHLLGEGSSARAPSGVPVARPRSVARSTLHNRAVAESPVLSAIACTSPSPPSSQLRNTSAAAVDGPPRVGGGGDGARAHNTASASPSSSRANSPMRIPTTNQPQQAGMGAKPGAWYGGAPQLQVRTACVTLWRHRRGGRGGPLEEAPCPYRQKGHVRRAACWACARRLRCDLQMVLSQNGQVLQPCGPLELSAQ